MPARVAGEGEDEGEEGGVVREGEGGGRFVGVAGGCMEGFELVVVFRFGWRMQNIS